MNLTFLEKFFETLQLFIDKDDAYNDQNNRYKALDKSFDAPVVNCIDHELGEEIIKTFDLLFCELLGIEKNLISFFLNECRNTEGGCELEYNNQNFKIETVEDLHNYVKYIIAQQL